VDLPLQALGDFFKERDGGLEVFQDFPGEEFGVGKVLALFETCVLEPQQVEVGFAALVGSFMVVGAEALGFLAVEAIGRVVTADEILRVRIPKGVGAGVVDPELPELRFRSLWSRLSKIPLPVVAGLQDPAPCGRGSLRFRSLWSRLTKIPLPVVAALQDPAPLIADLRTRMKRGRWRLGPRGLENSCGRMVA
jgi:hypothetical protein